jgi:hypothetical protein
MEKDTAMKKVISYATFLLGAVFIPIAVAGGESKRHVKTSIVEPKPMPGQTPMPIEFEDAPPPEVQDALMDMPAGDPAEIARLRKQQEEDEERKRLRDNEEWEAKKRREQRK